MLPVLHAICALALNSSMGARVDPIALQALHLSETVELAESANEGASHEILTALALNNKIRDPGGESAQYGGS